MIKVKLYGHLGKKFGRVHRMDVRTPAEAARALCANFPEFRAHFLKHGTPGYHVRVNGEDRTVEGLGYPIEKEIKFIPAITGAGPMARVIVGALIIWFTAGMATPLVAGAAAGTAGAMTMAMVGAKIGMALIIGGVAQILFAPPSTSGTTTDRPENKPGYAFDGPINTVAQGNAIPVCYGRLIVGSQVVSAGVETGDIAV